jgi:hypothetical protein
LRIRRFGIPPTLAIRETSAQMRRSDEEATSADSDER